MYKRLNSLRMEGATGADSGKIVFVKNGKMIEPDKRGERLVLKNGHVIDPENKVDGHIDIAIKDGFVEAVEEHIPEESGDYVLDCAGLFVFPGLIDMHLHMGDLFEVTTRPIECAVADGVTMGISPGAGNTFMAPALLGAEMDRGLPINAGVLIGAANVLGASLSVEELIRLFKGELEEETAAFKLSRNSVTNTTAPLVVGIKDHMGHFIMSDENLEKIFQITDKANLLYMSHTQDSEHAKRLYSLSANRPFHLGHATAAGAGSHGDALQSMRDVIALCEGKNVTAEFVTTMLRKGLGSREGLQMKERARQEALEALHAGIVKILVSDGQNQSTMKGFGDTRDNIPAILELAKEHVLTLPQAVAAMTCNPMHLLSERTKNKFWKQEYGHLGVGARGNVTVVDANDKLATYTIVNGRIAAFENRTVRSGSSAGRYVCKFGTIYNMGVGDLSMRA